MRNIVALSGGESSAAVAVLLKDTPDLILYYNDTGWEDTDLRRYLNDLSSYLGKPITEDSDGRTVEELAYSERFLPNNRVPLCSSVLKAKRLQSFATVGDKIYFGIGTHEIHRAARIRSIYHSKNIITGFPLIERGISQQDVHLIMARTGIKPPRIYAEGFEHNNCNGGCVRQGLKQWRHLLRVRPDVYAERERFEREFSSRVTAATFLKDRSLREVREMQEAQAELFPEDGWNGECIGMCGNMI